ncbi:hypothetical protein POVCU2_0096160 [Plasmodium ovale curtisi]|uniref:Uncharacterized protein n=1 Tax=Plasmodium ovale curtisi TaxID=864141 RepID=A0A1A8WT37_PLAOA|nr:hypothetical protein POVCU2_0096160 [Plasmodium ovale curtisi]SBT01477.1 hypothetical protein POVCU1_067180 [Plasmodium ovale curtisi]
MRITDFGMHVITEMYKMIEVNALNSPCTNGDDKNKRYKIIIFGGNDSVECCTKCRDTIEKFGKKWKLVGLVPLF